MQYGQTIFWFLFGTNYKIQSMVSIQKIPINFLCHMEGMSYNIGPPINFHIVCAPVHCTFVERIFNLGSSEFWRFVSLLLNDYNKIIKYTTLVFFFGQNTQHLFFQPYLTINRACRCTPSNCVFFFGYVLMHKWSSFAPSSSSLWRCS